MIEPEYTFTSSEPEIANFVEHDPESTNLRKPLQNSEGHVIPDPKSGILCAFNAGTRSSRSPPADCPTRCPVTVLGGSVEQPCGTVPLAASRFTKPASAADAGATRAPSARSRSCARPDRAPAPAAPVPALAPWQTGRQAPPPPAPALLFAPLLLAPQGGVPAIPPPPAGAFARPIPPGGATVRVFEEKREEEEATEQSQAFAAYGAEDYRGLPLGARAYASARGGGSPSPALYLLLVVVLAAAGVDATLRLGPKRRGRRSETAFATADAHSTRAQAARAQAHRTRRPRRQRP